MNDKDSSSRVNLRYLPDDLLLNCLARVSRLYYPTLSLVSKRFRSLVASKDIYEFRKLLGCTESCLYVCLTFLGKEVKPHWYTLCRIPNPSPWYTQLPIFRQITTLLTRKKKEKHCLVTVPTRNYSLDLRWWTLTTIGSNIYLIGGVINNAFSSKVLFMDCRSHTWHEAPSMRVSRNFSKAIVLDGKIYVMGGIKGWNFSNMVECFDPKTQKWEDVPITPGFEIREGSRSESLAIEGKLYLYGDEKNMVYKPEENGLEMFLGSLQEPSCVIDNVLYAYGSIGSSKRLKWYDVEGRSWRVLEGVGGLPKCYARVELVDYGGKIAVFWEEHVGGIFSHENNIWCAEISLKKRNKHEICGKIEWCDVVFKISKPCFPKFVVVTV